MAEKKITKREHFEGIKQFLVDNGKSEWAEVMAHEIDLLARKKSKSATATPAQKDALAIAEIIKDILAEHNEGMTVGALLKDERIKAYVRHNGEGVSSQVITGIFTKNTVSEKNPNGDFVRTLDKKVALYSLNYGVEGESEGE
jgi:hypothetical protein